MAQHIEIGKWGEQLAVDCLLAEGAVIRERNWRSGSMELDIIASKEDYFIFAEVKTRRNFDEDPLEAVDDRKRANIIRAAFVYLEKNNLPAVCRFDLFAIRGTPDNYTVEHIPDAFIPKIKNFR